MEKPISSMPNAMNLPTDAVDHLSMNIYGCLRTNSLTHSLQGEETFWKTNSWSAGKEIPCILQNPKVHYNIQKTPSPVPIQNQIKLVHGSPHPEDQF